MNLSRGGRSFGPAALILTALLALAPPPLAQNTSVEEFEEVDAYTGRDPVKLRELGVLSLGPFHWAEGRSSGDVREILGTDQILFLESEHFRIASTLGTYEQSGDTVEKDHLHDELARMARVNRKVKAKGRDLDPWLRAFLYVQRAEDLYAEFSELFQLTAADFPPEPVPVEKRSAAGLGPYLGQSDHSLAMLFSKTATTMAKLPKMIWCILEVHHLILQVV
jgi:hypothetical protein